MFCVFAILGHTARGADVESSKTLLISLMAGIRQRKLRPAQEKHSRLVACSRNLPLSGNRSQEARGKFRQARKGRFCPHSPPPLPFRCRPRRPTVKRELRSRLGATISRSQTPRGGSTFGFRNIWCLKVERISKKNQTRLFLKNVKRNFLNSV